MSGKKRPNKLLINVCKAAWVVVATDAVKLRKSFSFQRAELPEAALEKKKEMVVWIFVFLLGSLVKAQNDVLFFSNSPTVDSVVVPNGTPPGTQQSPVVEVPGNNM